MSYETFSTRCPSCGADGNLDVIRVTLTSSGRTLEVNVPLHADGFDISAFCSPTAKDLSTEDVLVRCNTCGAEFDSSQLLLS